MGTLIPEFIRQHDDADGEACQLLCATASRLLEIGSHSVGLLMQEL